VIRFACPSCQYQADDEPVCCPQCQQTFPAADLEELAHLRYVARRLREWPRTGVISAPWCQRALKAVDREARQIERRIGLPATGVMETPVVPPIAARPGAAAAAQPVAGSVASADPAAPPVPSPPARRLPSMPRRAVRPSFSWSQVGTYLLSERTLNGLLGLGAFLILAAGVVISTINPTGLAVLPHLVATIATAVVLYSAGYVVRQKLRLPKAGAALLAIGAAFIPLVVWTLGRDTGLAWSPTGVWLAASVLCLPVYLASQWLLRDRVFAVLSAVTGGSALLAVLYTVGVPIEWGVCALVPLAMGYLLLSRRLPPSWAVMSWALFWLAQIVVPLAMAALLVARYTEATWSGPLGVSPSASFDYAAGLAWWLGTAFYLLARYQSGERRYEYAAVWLFPFAYLFTLTKAPWDAPWYGLCLAMLAAAYLAGERRLQAPPEMLGRHLPSYVLSRPLYGAGLVLTAAAATWPFAHRVELIATLLTLALTYGVAAIVFRQRVWAWIGVVLLPAVEALLLAQLGLTPGERALAWAALAVALLVIGELLVYLSGEGHGGPRARIAGLAAWYYVNPVYLAGYILTAVSMVLAAGDRVVRVEVIGLGILIFAWSAWRVERGRHPVYAGAVERVVADRESGVARALFLYLACWLFPIWLMLTLYLWRSDLDSALYGLVLTLLAPLYVAGSLFFRRIRPEYRWPWFIGGCALAALGPLAAGSDLRLFTLSLAVSVGLCVAAAAVSRLPGWLYPVGLLMPILLWSVLDLADIARPYHGLGFAVLAMSYLVVSVPLQHGDIHRLLVPIREVLRPSAQPFVAISYILGVISLALAAGGERWLIMLVLALGAAHYAASAWIFRQSLFTYGVAVLLAALYIVGMLALPLTLPQHGPALLLGIGLYLASAEVLRRRLATDRWTVAVRGRWHLPRLNSWSLPFYALAYTATLAMPIIARSDLTLLAVSLASMAAVFGVSSVLFRHPAGLYVATLAGLGAYLAGVYAASPGAGLADAMVALIVPTWLFGSLAYIVGSRAGGALESTPRLLPDHSGPWLTRWAAPLTLAAGLSMVLSAVAGAAEPRAGLPIAVAYAILLSAFATVRRDEVEAWPAVAFLAMTAEEGLRLAAVSIVDQPPFWAGGALLGGLLAIGARRLSSAAARIWTRPLYAGSVAAGSLAIAFAASNEVRFLSHPALEALALTIAIGGLMLVAHAFTRRARVTGYLGVGLVLAGAMLQLASFDVGQPQVFVLPAGLYLFAVAYLEWRRGSDGTVKGVLEAAALALLLGVSIGQALGYFGAGEARYVYDTFLLVESVIVFGAGAVLRWKKPFFAGAAALIVDVGILLANPVQTVNTWYVVGLIGFTMIGLVLFVEQRRQQIPLWVDQWRRQLETWA
jgi:hypothetical protein